MQVWPVQQAWPLAPQLPHEPAVQVPPKLGQVDPAAVQRLSTQQPPDAQALPLQHASPAPPHGVQFPLLPHTRLAAPQARFAQQLSPLLPHGRQRPPLHTAPVP